MTIDGSRRQGSSGADGVRGLDHVGLSVPDLAAAVDFFRTAFGARVVFELDRFDDVEGGAFERLGADRRASLALTMLEIGDGRLELLDWRGPTCDGEWPDITRTGAPHVAIEVDSLGAVLGRLRDTPGVTILGEPMTFEEGPTPGLANAFVRAPWGCLIELVCWTRGRP